ncbi:hypothetical protein PoB_000320400 [Plakobranchus ocellatus]|uniref:Uncharacterized protein n=1 Tax=Plakobranchus ocellatus TaxID=259542 RepID=A0AAV3Y3A5_9GAST|nr:hypothetical protein PoB_000320400 [Plakobranchus ocellatus]
MTTPVPGTTETLQALLLLVQVVGERPHTDEEMWPTHRQSLIHTRWTGRGADGGARTRDRRVPADLRADSQATLPPTPPENNGTAVQFSIKHSSDRKLQKKRSNSQLPNLQTRCSKLSHNEDENDREGVRACVCIWGKGRAVTDRRIGRQGNKGIHSKHNKENRKMKGTRARRKRENDSDGGGARTRDRRVRAHLRATS